MSELHIALYRKYRPAEFSDVVGQDHIVKLLTTSIKEQKISHAYLFCGGRGTGKTTVARIFARDIGCNPEDIIEIDAASNRGIDEIRELRDAVRTSPFSSPYKVYIIDEAHMLTKEAANALLKTLEEPPKHVIFILATTDPEKLPETIVSRCQKLVFKQPDLDTLASRLVHVAKSEGKKLEVETAHVIANHGKGSYRDALGTLEQVLVQVKDIVKHEEVVAFLGLVDKDVAGKILVSVASCDKENFLKVMHELELSGVQPLSLYDMCVELIRKSLLVRIGGVSDIEIVNSLAKNFPYFVSSKTVLVLLDKRRLIEVSSISCWTAFQAIFLELLETE